MVYSGSGSPTTQPSIPKWLDTTLYVCSHLKFPFDVGEGNEAHAAQLFLPSLFWIIFSSMTFMPPSGSISNERTSIIEFIMKMPLPRSL